MAKRKAGLLLHITSLPGEGPVGNLGAGARAFVEFLQEAGQRLWQVLPLSPPARGNSPYSSVSVFAGNPLLISPGDLLEQGLLPPGSLEGFSQGPNPPARVDFAAAWERLFPLLRLCRQHSRRALAPQVEDFCRREAAWLEDYALFMALRGREGADFRRWPQPLKFREPSALAAAARALEEEIDFYKFVQYLFFRQWEALTRYAGARGVELFGDVPIYVDADGAEVWAKPHLFQLEADLRPARVAGVPPDAFSDQGQLWGNPLYDWGAMAAEEYRWWVGRLEQAARRYALTRIDHFRGFASYWSVPADSPTAREGRWELGPGMALLGKIKQALPHCRLVAEDLGLIDDEVRALLAESGLPGLSVLLFAFSPGADSVYLPHHIPQNRVAYVGTHDNDTAVGWLETAPPQEVAFARAYMNLSREEGEHRGFLRTLYATPADTAIAQVQDLLGLGNEARMNIPAQKEGNWAWRLAPGALTPELAGWLRRQMALSGR